jgi:hypothetical protein
LVKNDRYPHARFLLDFCLFDAPPKNGVMAAFGLVLGFLPKLSEHVEPFLYFFVPGWFIFLASRVFPLLRNPRRETVAFIFGLPFVARKQAALRFINAMQARLVILISAAIAAFAITQLTSGGAAAASKTAGFGAVLLGQALLLYLLVQGAIALGAVRPSKNDPRQVGLFHLRGVAVKQTVSRFILRIAGAVAVLVPGPAGIVLKRQALYLLRHDPATFVATWSIAIPALTLVAVMVRDRGAATISIALFALLCLLLFITTSCLGDSAEKLRACPYYSFSGATVVGANLLIALALCAPLTALCLLLLVRNNDGAWLRTAVDVGAFLLAAASLCLSMAQLWSWGQESRATVAAVALSLVCGLLGIMIPWYGFLFPAAAVAVAVLTVLPELKQT